MMFKMKSQLCEVFSCTEEQLKTRGILERLEIWLKKHPEHKPWDNPDGGEVRNSDIAVKFFDYCRKSNKNE